MGPGLLMMDARAKLRRGDALARDERYGEAIAEYQEVADLYVGAGFTLRAAAVLRQVVAIIDRSLPDLAEARTRALRGLLHCYTVLGLTTDADNVRRRLN
jgi:hypothetical protein